VGQISLIYTVGRDYEPQPSHRTEQNVDGTILTASIGEDFADCSWPVTVKAHATTSPKQLRSYVRDATEAIARGFYMNPRSGAGVYWRWTGTVPPGLNPDARVPIQPSKVAGIEVAGGNGKRSREGQGHPCGIYLLDDSTRWMGDGFYGTIQGATAISGGANEDFARSRWPIVIKVHPGVSRKKLVRYLTDLDVCVGEGLFFDAELRHVH
jgi:hypothetical protein